MAERTLDEVKADIERVSQQLDGAPGNFQYQQELQALETELVALTPPEPAPKAGK